MYRRIVVLGVVFWVIAACRPISPQAETPPTVIPFPTVTPGRMIRGVPPPPDTLRLDGSGGLANPATVVALANLPTATPDYALCPLPANPPLREITPTAPEIVAEIERFLSAGGSLTTLDNAMRLVWDVLDDAGTIRDDVDLTGEGTPEVLMAYRAPDDGGTLLILSCADGRYTTRYQAIAGGEGAPQIVRIGDLNLDGAIDVLFSTLLCAPGGCAYQSQLITWQAERGRFVSLLDGAIRSADMPRLVDVDNDRITEIAVQLTNPGTRETGPLRTGTLIYDWGGGLYVLSIPQLDPPRFRIQYIQEADRAMQTLDTDTAIRLYERSLTDATLENWLANEVDDLQSYALFRLLTLYAFTEDQRRVETYQTIVNNYFDPQNLPVYAQLSITFWEALQATGNIQRACRDVQAAIRARPEAIGILNRYGSSSPTYTARSLCPF